MDGNEIVLMVLLIALALLLDEFQRDEEKSND